MMTAKAHIANLFLLLIVIFLPLVTAGRFGDIARRKGYHPKLKPRADAQYGPYANGKDWQQKSRFLSKATQSYLVDHLPDVPFDVGELYAGQMPIDVNDPSRALYFIFQPSVGEPVDELTIWLNGGPGCSSLEGFLQENGLFIWGWGMYAPEINPYSWVNLTNMLWVEHPVGVGFSTGEVLATSEEEISKEFTSFLLNFQKQFGIRNFKIYVTGESYAGRYVSYVSAAILDRNDTVYFDLGGVLAYDPCIGSYDWVQDEAVAYPFAMQNNNVLGLNATFLEEMRILDVLCGYSAFREQYMAFPASGIQPPKRFDSQADASCDVWTFIYEAAFALNPCFNEYLISSSCPLLSDPLAYPTDLQFGYSGLQNPYFNRTDVKQAIHAPLNVSWAGCTSEPVFLGKGGPENEGDMSADPIQNVLPRVIEATNRVLIANGNLDFSIVTNGTLLSIQNMTWNGNLGFQSQPNQSIVIKLPDLMYQGVFQANGYEGLDTIQGTMGVQHYERGLMWAETHLSGHMEPQFQPRSAYRHLQWVLGRIDEL